MNKDDVLDDAIRVLRDVEKFLQRVDMPICWTTLPTNVTYARACLEEAFQRLPAERTEP